MLGGWGRACRRCLRYISPQQSGLLAASLDAGLPAAVETVLAPGCFGVAQQRAAPNLSPLLSSLLDLRRAASSGTQPPEDPATGSTVASDGEPELTIAGGAAPELPLHKSPTVDIVGAEGEAVLQQVDATAEPGGIGVAVSNVIARLGMPNYGEEPEDLGPPTPIERFDEVLEEWGELLEEGKYADVLKLMGRELDMKPNEIFAPVSDLNLQTEEPEEKVERRAFEEELKEQFTQRRVRIVDQLGRAYATGKRKTSIARVWLKDPPEHRRGLGKIVVNGRPFDDYFKPMLARMDVLAPFEVTSNLGSFDVRVTVIGGGFSGQAQAVRHGISKALQYWDPELRPALKAQGFLTRDSRVVERKKPGRAKARKSFQWVKR